jgi:hypothetical protein
MNDTKADALIYEVSRLSTARYSTDMLINNLLSEVCSINTNLGSIAFYLGKIVEFIDKETKP